MLKGFVQKPPLYLCLPSTQNQISHKICEKNKNYFRKNEKCAQNMFVEYKAIIMYEEGKL